LFIFLWVEVFAVIRRWDGDFSRDGLYRRVRIGRNGEAIIGPPVGGFLFALPEVLQNPVLTFDHVGRALVVSLLKLFSLTGLHGVDREDCADAPDGRAASGADDRSDGIV
jgi:hypothetical protein